MGITGQKEWYEQVLFIEAADTYKEFEQWEDMITQQNVLKSQRMRYQV